MNKRTIKIFLLLLAALYFFSFLEVSDAERNLNYDNEQHSYVVSDNASITVKNLCNASNLLSNILIVDDIQNQLSDQVQFYHTHFNGVYYSPQKIHLINSVFLI